MSRIEQIRPEITVRREPGGTRAVRLPDLMALGQGIFYLLAGIWPLLHMPSFLAVTGPKKELWLVRTVGALVSVIGCVLSLAGLRRKTGMEESVLAAGGAASLAAIDVVYVARGRIRPVYLADAVVEMLLVAGWAGTWVVERRRNPDFPRGEE